MVAIDKMYVHSYYEYDDLRRWAIAYYPELLFYFYDITKKYQEWEDNCRAYVKQQIVIAKRDYEKIGVESRAVENLIKRYKEVADYDCSTLLAKPSPPSSITYPTKAHGTRTRGCSPMSLNW